MFIKSNRVAVTGELLALAMLESVNSHLLNEFARYGDCYGNEQFTPVTLH